MSGGLRLRERYAAWRGRSGSSRKIFILGTGRSGTHWLGYILDSHPDCVATIETPEIFRRVSRMALDPTLRPRLLPGLLRRYRIQHARAAPFHYVDKSHPNLWLAEALADAFEDAVFVGIVRDPFATVASMLRHDGVLEWHRRWKDFPVPNPFLGITVEIAEEYDTLPMAARCALRWQSHRDEMVRLTAALGSRLYVVEYEALVREPEDQLSHLADFLGFSSPIPSPEVKRESLSRWQEELGRADREAIEAVVGVPDIPRGSRHRSQELGRGSDPERGDS